MQPFTGIRVLDFTHVLAGPFCTYQLAVMGADVIKIESPGGGDMMRPESSAETLAAEQRGSQFLSQSGNKRSLLVDLNTPDGVKIIRRLAERADVVVENFRKGVLARAGLGYKDLSDLNPRLIYCSMTGFGQSGPKSGHPAYDNVIQAFSGLMAHTGSVSTAPVRVGPPVLDYGTGAQAAFAVAAALFQRAATNQGQYIDVAMLDAALMLMSTSVVDTQVTGAAPLPPGNSSPKNAAYACYDTADGLLMIGAFTTKQYSNVWRVLEQPQIADVTSALEAKELVDRLPADSELLANLLKQQSAQHWEDCFNLAGVPAARVRQLDETLREPQLAARQGLQTAQGLPDEHSTLKMPVAAFSYLTDGPQLKTHAPSPGEHSREILLESGHNEVEIDKLIKQGVVGAT